MFYLIISYFIFCHCYYDITEGLEEFILEEKGLLLSTNCKKHPVISVGCGLRARQFRSLSAWVVRAQEETAIGCDMEAVIAYVMGREYVQAAAMAITALKKLVKEPLDLTHGAKRMIRSLKVSQ